VRDEVAPRVKLDGKVIPKWTPHDLRRSVGTRLQQLGYSKQMIDAGVLHHVEPGVRGTYLRYEYEAESGAALQALANHIDGLRMAENVVTLPRAQNLLGRSRSSNVA
jgi:hypothetical protein